MSAWWTHPDGRPRLVLNVFGDTDGIDGYECAAIDLTPEVANRLLDLIASARAMKKVYDNFAALEVWDYSAEFFARDYDADVDARDDHQPPLWERDPDGDSRTEMDRVCADAFGHVHWVAWVKHSDPAVHLSTEEVPESWLREVWEGLEPQAS